MGWKAATDLVAIVLKDTMRRLSGTQTYWLSSSLGAVAHKAPGGRQRGGDLTNFRMRAGGGSSQGSYIPRESTGIRYCSFVEP